LTDDQVRQLENYDWPGNVRELQNVVERTVIRARHGSLRLDLPEATESDSGKQSAVIPDAEMKRRESENVAAALRLSKGRIYGRGGAAELLGIKPTTLAARIKTLGLKQVT